jgi:hypothetical protein
MKSFNYREKARFAIELMSVVLIGFLSSCSQPVHIYRLYEGPIMPSEETAQLLCKGDEIQIKSVNGKKSPDGKDTFGKVKLEIRPGDYQLTVSFSGKTMTLVEAGVYYYNVFYRLDSVSDVDITVKAEAGHTYLVTSTRDYKKSIWYAVVRDETDDRILVNKGPYPLNKIRTGDNQETRRVYTH